MEPDAAVPGTPGEKTAAAATATHPSPRRKERPKKKMTMAGRANLILQPNHARRALSQFKNNVSPAASVYVAAQCEYLLAEIAETAIRVAKDNGRKRVTVADVATAIRSDRELDLAVGDIVFTTSQSLTRKGPSELGVLFA